MNKKYFKETLAYSKEELIEGVKPVVDSTWLKFLNNVNAYMEEPIDIETVSIFSHWEIFNSILSYYNQFGKLSEKQYAVFVRHFDSKLSITLPEYRYFTRGYTRVGKTQTQTHRHMWSKDVSSTLFYDLPLKDNQEVYIEVIETKGTQSLVKIEDKLYKTHELITGNYRFNRTKHKGFLKMIKDN